MSSRYVTIMLSTLLAVVITVAFVARQDPSIPNWEFMPEMNRSQAVQPFEVSAEFTNGRAQQEAVYGTISRGLMPLHFQDSKEEAIRAGEELLNPYLVQQDRSTTPLDVAPTSEPEGEPKADESKSPDSPEATAIVTPETELAASKQRGEVLYRVYCLACHGPTGAGDGPVAQRGFPPPPPLPTGKSVQMKDGQLYHVLSFGQGSMPSMAAQLDRDQRWDVINYVRSLQEKAQATPSTSTTDSNSTSSQSQSSQP